MSWNNKVLWTEGMFLRPQHFQQQERYYHHLLESRSRHLQAYSWGITECTIDQQLLEIGKISLKSCTGIFPDGTPFSLPEEADLPPPIEVSASCKETVVLLALPLKKNTGNEVSREHNADGVNRFQSQEIKIKDTQSISTTEEIELEVGALKLQLMLDGKDKGAYATLPIAHISERRNEGQVVLNEQFIPSCLLCTSSSYLTDAINQLNGSLHHRGEALANRIGTPGAGGVAEVSDFLFLQILNRYEPLFTHLADTRQLHPEQLFQICLQMAGELSTITRPQKRFDAYPQYQHDNLIASFQPLLADIHESLNWVPELRATPIPLETHKFGIRTAAVNDSKLIRSAEFILAVHAQVATDKLHYDFPKQTTITTKDKLRDFVMSHTPGIKLVARHVAPRQIPYHANFAYFELDKSDKLWDELATTGTIAMHFAGDYPGLELELWAIKG